MTPFRFARITATSLALAVATTVLGAQADPPTANAESNRARELYEQGRRLWTQGRSEEARVAFQAAFSVLPHWQLAAYLGRAELKTGRYHEAADHLTFAMQHLTPDATPAQRQELEHDLTDVKSRFATVQLTIAQSGSALSVDGQTIGTSPLAQPLFVDPGVRTFEARSADRSVARKTLSVEAGKAYEIELKADGEQPSKAPGIPSAIESRLDVGPRVSGPPTWLLVTEVGLTAAALGVGVGFSLRASSLASDTERIGATLGGPTACSSQPDPRCDELRSKYDDRDRAAKVATIGYVGAGIFGAATLATLLFFRDHSASSTAHASSTMLAPVWGPSFAGAAWEQHF